jgi:hypothetical protein
MDESTKLIIAYATMLTGIPIIAAKMLWFVPGSISGRLLVHISRGLDEISDDAIAGFISLLLACLLFEHLGLEIVYKIPLILIVVNAVWKKEMYHVVAFMVGTVAGFALYPRVLPHLSAALFFSNG